MVASDLRMRFMDLHFSPIGWFKTHEPSLFSSRCHSTPANATESRAFRRIIRILVMRRSIASPHEALAMKHVKQA